MLPSHIPSCSRATKRAAELGSFSVLRERSAQGLRSQGLDPWCMCLAVGALNFSENGVTRLRARRTSLGVAQGSGRVLPRARRPGLLGRGVPLAGGVPGGCRVAELPLLPRRQSPWLAFTLLPPDALDLKVACVRTSLGSDLCTRPAETLLGTCCARSPGRWLGLGSRGPRGTERAGASSGSPRLPGRTWAGLSPAPGLF